VHLRIGGDPIRDTVWRKLVSLVVEHLRAPLQIREPRVVAGDAAPPDAREHEPVRMPKLVDRRPGVEHLHLAGGAPGRQRRQERVMGGL
jgi:hypothetical protein